MTHKSEQVATTCPYCGVGCGVRAAPGTTVAGDRDHPANRGRLCVKGASLHETIAPEEPPLTPRICGNPVSWERAMDEVAGAIRQAVAQYGPESVAFYLSGQLLTEDYYVANKLAKGFIGTPHVDTNSRLCMSSAVAAHKRAFGEDVVPGCYDDLELAELLVLTGSNAAWNHPVLYQRMKAAARPGRRVVVIDPRRTATAELADLHLPIRPGSDVALFNGLLVWLAETGAVDQHWIRAHTVGFDQTLAMARQLVPSVDRVAELSDLPEQAIRTFYRWFAETPRTVTAFSQGVNQSIAGTDKANGIINCHLATGRVGLPGASPFSLTGQPNAMGGREVGGLANTLAAHMDYETPGARAAVAEFWRTDRVPQEPGYKAVELFEAVRRGDIRVLWIMGTNPAVSLPHSERVREAIRRCPVVIASDCVSQTDSTTLADIFLPARGWGQKDGTVTNSERCISRQRAFLPPGGARADWQILAETGRRLGYGEAFNWTSPAAVFREHARLSGLNRGGPRRFDLSAMAGITDEDYQQLAPIQWPVTPEHPTGCQRLYGDGRFSTPDCRARFVPVRTAVPHLAHDNEGAMVLNTGRIRDQWHTMTRTGRAPRLTRHRPEPFIDLHSDDLGRLGLKNGDLARLTAAHGGRFIGRVRAEPGQRQRELFIPIHWSGMFTGSGLASALTTQATDPVSGQPDSKYSLVSVTPFRAHWQARLLRPLAAPRLWQADYHALAPQEHCGLWFLAGEQPVDWPRQIVCWLGGAPDLVLEDHASGTYRAARIRQGRLEGVLMVAGDASQLPDTTWLGSLFDGRTLSGQERRGLLAARSVDIEETGAIICSCFGIGERQIASAIDSGATTVSALGEKLRCGTNCGSCLPELKAVLDKRQLPATEI